MTRSWACGMVEKRGRQVNGSSASSSHRHPAFGAAPCVNPMLQTKKPRAQAGESVTPNIAH